jgi:hypothetical protein
MARVTKERKQTIREYADKWLAIIAQSPTGNMPFKVALKMIKELLGDD